jgi:hypothetical protein
MPSHQNSMPNLNVMPAGNNRDMEIVENNSKTNNFAR